MISMEIQIQILKKIRSMRGNKEKGSNSEREMAYMMSVAGFNVKDIHMTDIISEKKILKTFSYLLQLVDFQIQMS